MRCGPGASFETPAAQAPNTKVKIKFRLGGKMEKILSSAVGRPRRWATQDEGRKEASTKLTASRDYSS